jgi:probable rRNA maturation factor
MIEVVNRQRYKSIDLQSWSSFATKALSAIGKESHTATIAFVSNRRMRELNKQFRGLDKTTDVLSFPSEPDELFPTASPNLGDVAVSVEQAEQQARAHGLEFDQELAQLILHGLLHLSGYDHETDNGEMNRLERQLRRKLGI